MMYDAFFNKWMMFDDHWHPAQRSSCNKHNEADKSESNTKIKQHEWNMRLTGMRIPQHSRKYHLEEIQPVTKNQQHAHERHGSPIAL